VPFLLQDSERALESSQQHLRDLGNLSSYAAHWRQEVFLEMYYCSDNVKCTSGCQKGNYPFSDSNCGDLVNNEHCWCGVKGDQPSSDPNCYTTEDETNNFIAIRRPPGIVSDDLGDAFAGKNLLYAEFMTGNQALANIDFSTTDFTEYYDLTADAWEMNNLAVASKVTDLAALHARVQRWAKCKGADCDPASWQEAKPVENDAVVV